MSIRGYDFTLHFQGDLDQHQQWRINQIFYDLLMKAVDGGVGELFEIEVPFNSEIKEYPELEVSREVLRQALQQS